MVIEERKPSVP